jgi:ABC-2 type transport system ATP-binding protein
MKRKLEILRSLIHRPRVLFLDEPTTGLDPQSRRNLWEYLRDVRREEDTTIFLTTHYLEESEEADRVCIVGNGKVVSFGAPDEVKSALVGEEYVVLDAQDREALRRELGGRGIPYEGEGPVRVYLGEGRTAQGVIKAIETPLTVVRTHSPTLEDAYLAIVGEK